MLFIKEEPEAVSFKVKVQPRASKNQVAGLLQDALKVRIASPPVDGEANQTCIEFFAKLLGVPKSKVQIVSGQTGRNKLVRVEGLSVEQLQTKLKL